MSVTLAAQKPPQQPAQGATISGVVVMAGSDSPVRGAVIRMMTPNERVEVTTDGDGRFEFRGLAASGITIGASKAGFVSQTISFAERGLEPIPPASAVRMEIRLVRGAAIAGRVFDRYGDPVSGATVSALRLHYQQPGQPVPRLASVAQTNDLGEYRLYGLEPASYFVATDFLEVMRQFYSIGSAASRGPAKVPAFTAPRPPAPTFAPGTTYAAEAQLIALAPGDQLLGTDLRTTGATTVYIAGRVVDFHGVAVEDTYVILNVAASTGAMRNGSRVTMTDATGAFAFPGVPPGDYVLQAVALATPLGVAAREKGQPSTERGVPEFADERVAAFGDQADVQVRTRPGVDVPGRITIDGTATHPAAGSQIRIVAVPVRTAGDMTNSLLTAEAAVNPDGTFTLKNIAGHRMIQVVGLPVGSFLRRIGVGDVDVTDDGVEMRQAAGGLRIELTMKPAVLDVNVTDASGRPLPGSVVVFSEDGQLWTRHLSRHLRLRTGTGGTVRFDDLPEGRYLVAVLGAADRASWADPAFLERLRPNATPVTIVAGETRAVTVHWR